MSRRIFQEIAGLTTEGIHPGSQDLDSLSVAQILQFMSAEDALVAPAVRKVLPQIEKAVEKVLASFQTKGRLIYIGAGNTLYAIATTSGGLADSPWPCARHDNHNTGNVSGP